MNKKLNDATKHIKNQDKSLDFGGRAIINAKLINCDVEGAETGKDAVKYTEQSLTDAQKAQARTNIGAGAATDVTANATAIAAETTRATNAEGALQTMIAAVGSEDYVEAWDGSSTPVAANIPAGVVVTYNTTDYTGTLAASASTTGKIYLVADGNGNYDRYVTSVSGSTYSWQHIGNTDVALSDYATKAELGQLDQFSTELDVTDTFTELEVIKTGDVNVGSAVNMTPASSGSYGYLTIQVKAGDVIRIKGAGGSGPRLWAFVDSADKLLSKSASDATASDYLTLTATQEGTFIYNSNVNATNSVKFTPKKDLHDKIAEIDAEIADLDTYPADVDKGSLYVENKVISTGSINVGSAVSLTPTDSQSYGGLTFPVVAGEKIKITGRGGSGPRLWAFVDVDNKLLSKAASDLIVTSPLTLTVEANGTFIYNSYINAERSIVHETTISLADKLANISNTANNAESVAEGNSDLIDDLQNAIYGDSLVLKKTVALKPNSAVLVCGYLGKFNGTVKVEGASSTKFYLRAKKKGTSDTVYILYYDSAVSLPLTEKNVYSQYELVDVEIGGFSTTEEGDYTITFTPAEISDGFVFDMPLSPFNSEDIFLAADFQRMTAAQVYAKYDALLSAHSDYISKTSLGTIEYPAVGTIPAESVTCYRYDFVPKQYPDATNVRVPKVLLLSGIHPEQMAISALYYAMEAICEDWESNPALEALRFGVHFIVVPVASPWAVNHDSRVNANGVDINRNFAPGWVQGEYVAPPSATSTYGGSAALSEDETQFIADIIDEESDIILGIDFHNNFGTDDVFWVSSRPELLKEQNIGAAFLRLIPRTEARKYSWLTPETELGYMSFTSPGGTAARQIWQSGAIGQTIETTEGIVSGIGMTDNGELLTISRDGFLNYIVTALAAILIK